MAETIGSIVDKLSILQLKIYHMSQQADRTDVGQDHREKAKQKVNILLEQQKDLAEELDELAEVVLKGEKKLKVYRQFKMYNDPIYKSKKL